MKIKLLVIILLSIAACSAEKTMNEKWQDLKTNATFENLLKNAPDFIETPYFDSICGWLNDSISSKKYVQLRITNLIDSINSRIEEEYQLYNASYFENLEFSLKERDLFQICLVDSNCILNIGEEIPIDKLKELTKEFIANPCNDYNLSEKMEKDIKLLGWILVPKGTLTIIAEHGFDKKLKKSEWKLYFRVLLEFKKAYNELRNDYSVAKFGISYDNLKFPEKSAVTQVYPYQIELNFMRGCRSITPPPPPQEIIDVLNIVDDDK